MTPNPENAIEIASLIENLITWNSSGEIAEMPGQIFGEELPGGDFIVRAENGISAILPFEDFARLQWLCDEVKKIKIYSQDEQVLIVSKENLSQVEVANILGEGACYREIQIQAVKIPQIIWATIKADGAEAYHLLADPRYYRYASKPICLSAFEGWPCACQKCQFRRLESHLEASKTEIEQELDGIIREFGQGLDVGYIDVRLVCGLDSASWQIFWGDPQYDGYHGDYCSASSLSRDADLAELAAELIAEIIDQLY